jgi:hypothetical protein
MATLTQIKEVLDAPRRAQETLRASTSRRLQILEYAELEVARRTQECDVREAVFRRAVDAGPGRSSEEQLRRWVDKELLPSLPPPVSVVQLTGELEERAAELDAILIELQERELVLRHERETLLLKSSEVCVREEEVERRVRESADLARKVELEIDSRSQAYGASRKALNSASVELKMQNLVIEERAYRAELRAHWCEWCLAASRDADRLKRRAEADERGMRTAKQVISKWKAFTGPTLDQTHHVDFEISLSPLAAPQRGDKHSAAHGVASVAVANAQTQCGPQSLSTTDQGTQTRRTAPVIPQMAEDVADRRLIDHRASSAWSSQPPVYLRDPSVVVLPAYDTEGDMFDAVEEEALQRQQVEITRVEGVHREKAARLAAREGELSALRDYLRAQRASVDEMSAHLLMRLEKLMEAEIKLQRREDLFKEKMRSQKRRSSSDDESTEDDRSASETTASDRHITVHPLFGFTRVDPSSASATRP